jgi:ferredoxin
MCARAGLEVPELSKATVAHLDTMLPPYWSRSNPVDIVGETDNRLPLIIMEEFLKWEGCDAIINLGILGRRIFVNRLADSVRAADPSYSEEFLVRAKKYLDLEFKYTIAQDKSGKDLYECFSCGTCTAGCPERDLDALYSPRKVIKNVLLGMKEPVFSNKFVEICSSHHRCLTQCPQGVEIPKLMNAIKNIAMKEGYNRTIKE